MVVAWLGWLVRILGFLGFSITGRVFVGVCVWRVFDCLAAGVCVGFVVRRLLAVEPFCGVGII